MNSKATLFLKIFLSASASSALITAGIDYLTLSSLHPVRTIVSSVLFGLLMAILLRNARTKKQGIGDAGELHQTFNQQTTLQSGLSPGARRSTKKQSGNSENED